VVLASSSQIKPREKGLITAKIDARNYKGNIVKNIRVYSNDPTKPEVTLTLRAEIRSSSKP
jgi:hypothetical protein